MGSDWHVPAKTVLLTGAGFTKTFGGLLAREMWSAIKLETLNLSSRRLDYLVGTVRDLDFEQLHANVQSDPELSEGERRAFNEVLLGTYRRLHERTCGDFFQRPRCAGVFQHFISWFSGSYEDKTQGYLFTLNQDLFVEHFYTAATDRPLSIPGFDRLKWFSGDPSKIAEKDFRVLPTADEVLKIQKQFAKKSPQRFAYVKLHGSVGWKFHDGTPGMVIGHQKILKIRNEPLLNWYFSLFSSVLNADSRNLLIIGYGFRDEHINNVILDAISSSGLTVFVVWPGGAADIHEVLHKTGWPDDAIRKVYPYEDRTVANLYRTTDTLPTADGQRLLRDLDVPGWKRSSGLT